MNINDILVIISNCLHAASGWFTSILSSIPGSFELLICAFGVMLCARFLIRPLFGGAGSDRVARIRIRSRESDN